MIKMKKKAKIKMKGQRKIQTRKSDSQASEVRRCTRTSQPVLQLEPSMSGKSYAQNDKKKRKVSFVEVKLKQLEYCHNLVAQVKPDKEKVFDYGSNQAMLIARFIQDITKNVNEHGASLAQQYMLQKGLKVFGKKGHSALMKEID
jgi:chemotaxis protein histidine kinase CheA